jgi:hypothetical protein
MTFNIILIGICSIILAYISYDIYNIPDQDLEDFIDDGKCVRDCSKTCRDFGCCMFLDDEEF